MNFRAESGPSRVEQEERREIKMGKGSNLGINETSAQSNQDAANLPIYTWEEIKNNKPWIVIDGYVYDIGTFSKKHPGGPKIIKNHVGQDASVKLTTK